MTKNSPLTYSQTGVDIDKGDQFVERIAPHARATKRLGAMDQLGGFGGLFDLKALNMNDPLLVGATDGVGSKLDIAMELQKYDTIGIDLVAMCVNDLICQGAEPLFFLDYFAVHALSPEIGEDIVKGVSEGCIQANCQLIGGETAEMPSLYPKDKFDLAGFCVGAVERGDVLPKKSEIQAGHRVIGVSSSGLHSNGYSLIRAVLEKAELKLEDILPGTGFKLGELMIEPTRIYVQEALSAAGDCLGFAHITGGGLMGNIKRILPEGLGLRLDMSLVPAPELARFAIDQSYVEAQEAYRVWNMGIGLVAIVEDDSEKIGRVMEAFSAFEVYDLGEVTGQAENRLIDHKFQLKG